MFRRAYPTDLTDAQWAILESLVPPCSPVRTDQRHALRAMGRHCLASHVP